jgi:hypothetical protein
MGGINPEKPMVENAEANLGVQQHTRALLLTASHFFAGHAALEDSVIAESQGRLDADAVSRAAASFRAAAQHAADGATGVRALAQMTEGGDWQHEYVARQQPTMTHVGELLDRLASAATESTMTEACDERRLQASLWHQNANSQVRELSVAAVRDLVALLEHHATVVEDTNRN